MSKDFSNMQDFDKRFIVGDTFPEMTDKYNQNLERLRSLCYKGILEGGESTLVSGTVITFSTVKFHYNASYYTIPSYNFDVDNVNGTFYLYFDSTNSVIVKTSSLDVARTGIISARIVVSGGAGVLEDLYWTPGSPYFSDTSQYYGQVFTASDSYTPTKVTIPIEDVGGGSGWIKVLVTGVDGSNKPDLTNIIGSSDQLDEASIPDNWTMSGYEFPLTTISGSITNGTKYAVVIQKNTTVDNVMWIQDSTGINAFHWTGIFWTGFNLPRTFLFKIYSGFSVVDEINDLREIIPNLAQDVATLKYYDTGSYSSDMTSAAVWYVNHDLDTEDIASVICFDESKQQIIPNSVTIVDEDNITIDWGGVPEAGRVKVRR